MCQTPNTYTPSVVVARTGASPALRTTIAKHTYCLTDGIPAVALYCHTDLVPRHTFQEPANAWTRSSSRLVRRTVITDGSSQRRTCKRYHYNSVWLAGTEPRCTCTSKLVLRVASGLPPKKTVAPWGLLQANRLRNAYRRCGREASRGSYRYRPRFYLRALSLSERWSGSSGVTLSTTMSEHYHGQRDWLP